MKSCIKSLFLVLSLSNFIFITAWAQNTPAALRADIKVSKLISVSAGCSRLARDPISGNLYYINSNGNVYEVINKNGTYSSLLIAATANHNIVLLQGMAFKGKTLFLTGNRNGDSISYQGIIAKGVLQSSGKRVWSRVMTTEKYGYTNTSYNHGYSGIAVSPDSNFLYINSGSRTDHGEVQTRAGLKPGLREEPLTSAIFRIPINASNIVLPNDSAKQVNLGYLYADGTRNSFDLAFDANGNLFGCENSGDRDDPDELNWIRQGHFYGFPWIMGGDTTPMQFAGYDPSKDKLISPYSGAAKRDFFYNDPAYPKRPNRIFTGPVINLGPDEDEYRDPKTGSIKDASSMGTVFNTFTSHRSPLGLVFDRDSLLSDEFKGHGFLLGWTAGVTPGSTALGPFSDPGQDLAHIQLIYDAASDNYKMETHRIVGGFNNPVDAEMVGNVIYVIEYGGTSPGIWKVEMPLAPVCSSGAYVTREQYNNIPGKNVSDLTGNKNYPAHPSSTARLTSLEAPLNTGDNYGARIRGYITAPVTGNYTFWVAADDAAELWLSKDTSAAGKKKIASVISYTNSRDYLKFPAQKSAAISLKAGKKYYFEALQKEGTGGDNISVRWQMPNGVIETPIPCTRLAPVIIHLQAAAPAVDNGATLSDSLTNPLKVFPNPAKNILNVRLSVKSQGSGNLNIRTLTGVDVYNLFLNFTKGDNQVSVNSSTLNQGLYILTVTLGGNKYIKKVLIR